MSAEIKKPPVAPKPRFVLGKKPPPPPVAPKPDINISEPLSTHKGPKPALAPKPILSKITPVAEVKPTPLRNNKCSEGIKRELNENVKCRACQDVSDGVQKGSCELTHGYIKSNCSCKAEYEYKYINGENTYKTQFVIDHLSKLETLEKNKKCDQTNYSSRIQHRSETQCGKTVNKYQIVTKAGFPEQKFKDVLTQVVSPNNYLPKQKDVHCDADVKLHSSSNGQSVLFITDQTFQNIRNSKRNTGEPFLDGPKDYEIKNAADQSEKVIENGKNCHSSGIDHKERVHNSQPKAPFTVAGKEKLIFQDTNFLITTSASTSAPCNKPVPMPKPKKARLIGLIRQNCVDDSVENAVDPNVTCNDSCFKTPDGTTVDFKKSFGSMDADSVSRCNSESSYQTGKMNSASLQDNITEPSQAKDYCNQSVMSCKKPVLDVSLKVKITSDLQNRSKIEKIKKDLESGNRTLPAGNKGSFIRSSSLSMSLPKYLSLSYAPKVPVLNRETGSDFEKVTSSEEMPAKSDISPKTVPEKPQRHSLPASVIVKRDLSVGNDRCASGSTENDSEDQHGSLSSRETNSNEHKAVHLSEKPVWKLPHPILPFLGSPGTVTVTSTSQNKEAIITKPRAKSLSSADSEKLEKSPKEPSKKNSFKRILGIKLSAKMKTDFQKFLTKGSYSLDSAPDGHPSVESKDNNHCISGSLPGDQKNKPVKAHSADSYCQSAKKDHKLKNLSDFPNNFPAQPESLIELHKGCPQNESQPISPKYENISANFDWKSSSSVEDCDTTIYEIQPYAVSSCYQKYRATQNQCISPVQDQDNHSSEMDINSDEEEVIFSSDEEDTSSDTSKGELDQQDEKQNDEGRKTKVYHIAREIMSSEKVFVDVLKLLHIDFRDSVSQSSRQYGKQVIEDKILNQILYYLPQLYELNRGLLRELEERMAHWDEHRRIADIFMEKGPYLKMYSTYIKEFDKNVCLLDEQCKKNPTFAAVVREFEMSSRCANLALKHYLLKPVQRIPQYKLLLTDYVKNLSRDCADYKDTQAALAIVIEVANHANDIMKQGDNFQKLMQIQYSLNGQQEIVQPGRVFLKEGTLMKLSRKVMQPRMFFLLNDVLLYTTPVQSGMYKLNNMLSLAGIKVSKPSQEAYQNELNIESVERSFILSASSAAERDEWLEAISKAIEDYTKKRITFTASKSLEEEPDKPELNTPLGTKAPIWIPDPRATMCMICTCDFTLTWRRHHCRACGKIVCQACSSNKFNLDYLKNRPARVCDHCFLELQKREMQSSDTKMLSPTHKSSSALTSVFHSIQHSSGRKHKKIPAALKEVSANTGASSMSGYLYRSKGIKKPWKRLWFVIQDKVLYTYAASEDVAALESQPLLGFTVSEVQDDLSEAKVIFQLLHKRTLFYVFKADDRHTARRWVEVFQEATVL
ncbi:FYVE, RhoGEF and PH domain-containing protein 6 isoform X1 [Carcharodon carcharias]|uniref:FYVE, RhoGEF and PH domain-containing protein 6 isoform X1 n=1 Tax=Carcharodon carcharias TaxID=13397 RepID=UPI001B7EB451|nr:FYVE, RhoGEF and PH domain-containing protein 6 isoform X1 [Carcharodon carcharias]